MQEIRSQTVCRHHRAAPDAGHDLVKGQKNEAEHEQKIGQHGSIDRKSPAPYSLYIDKENERIANNKQRSTQRRQGPLSQRPFEDQEEKIQPDHPPKGLLLPLPPGRRFDHGPASVPRPAEFGSLRSA